MSKINFLETSPEVAKEGCLYVIATPIGNLADLSYRATGILKSVNQVICENLKRARMLLAYVNANPFVVAYNQHNERQRLSLIIQQLKQGRSMALISDAGTPLLSDPGLPLLRACHKEGIQVIPIPGPSALTVSLSMAGLPVQGFLFVGFPPPKIIGREKLLKQYQDFPSTLVFYEAPHRIEKFLTSLLNLYGKERVVFVGRELTKIYESYAVGAIESVRLKIIKGVLKGEFTIAVAPQDFVL